MDNSYKNLGENHSVVEDLQGNFYAFDHQKQNWTKLKNEDEVDLHPIGQDGDANFNIVVRMKKKSLTGRLISNKFN